jgi:hypothetical protein
VLVPLAAWLTQRHGRAALGGSGRAVPGRARASLVPLFVLAFIAFIAVRTAGDALFPMARLAGLVSTGTRPRICSSPAA